MINFNPIQEWYYLPEVKFEMIRFNYNREFSMIIPSWAMYLYPKKSVRNLKCHTVQSLDFFYKYFKMFENGIPYNFYYSLAELKNGIYFRKCFKGGIEDVPKEWNFNDYIIGYDFVLDIDVKDSKDILYAHETMIKVVEVFDKFNVPYDVRFSGMGFHIVISYKYMPKSYSLNPNDKNTIYKLYSSIAKKLYKKYSELVDKNIYDSRRVLKIPYSLSLYEDGYFMCCPLDKSQMDFFDINDYAPDKWKNKIKGRGVFLYNENGNISDFLKKFKIK